MEKIRYIPLFLFGIFASKLLILGSSWTDVALTAVLGAVAAFWEFKSQDKKMQVLEESLKKQELAIVAAAKALDDVRTGVSSLKLANGLKQNNAGRL